MPISNKKSLKSPLPVSLKQRKIKGLWPTRYQWFQLLKILSKKEKGLFFIFLLLFISSSIFLLSNIYFKNTKVVPAQGGTYTEGLIGQPRFINPIYDNSDVDRDLTQLIFSGLMKYDKNFNIIPDLADGYEVEQNEKVYKFYLKENLFWEDKTPLTSSDVFFTIKAIQNPEYKSPLRANWVGVEVEKLGDYAIKFTLKKPYSAFLENCTTKILPEHIWQNIDPENAPFEVYNLQPIGSGPYKLVKTEQEKASYGTNQIVKSLTLKRNPLYHGKKPNISEIKFSFFDNEKDLAKSAKKEKIKGLSLSYFNDLGKNWQNYFISLPRYFALFLNTSESDIMSDKNVRIALNYATNKEEIIKKILKIEDSSLIEETISHSPVLPKVYEFDSPEIIYQFDIEKAKNILEEVGFKETESGIREKVVEKKPAFEFTRRLEKGSKGIEVTELQKCLSKFPDIYPDGEITGYFGNKSKEAVIKFQEKYRENILDPWGFTSGTGIVGRTTRKKLNEVCFKEPDKILPLKFSIITVDQPQLVELAEEIKNQWEALGAEIEIKKFPVFQLEQDFIKPRDYDVLLFGEVLGAIPDLLPFWHSSQKRDPGLNLSMYEDKKVDELLKQVRISSNEEFKKENLTAVQGIIIEDAPAVFLFCPDYIYSVSKKIKGIEVNRITDPSKRFSDVENWYIKTKRIWK